MENFKKLRWMHWWMGKWTLEPVGDERKIQKEVMFQELEWCEPEKLALITMTEILVLERNSVDEVGGCILGTRLRGAEWVRETDIVRLLHGWGCRRIELLQDWVGNKRKTTSWEECTELLETRNVCFRGILHRILGGRRFVEDLGN